jgi:rod shape-determining protein MreC
MGDEKIQVGDSVITTGGDRVFPKGLKVGTVASVAPDSERDPFLNIKVKPAADLSRLEEVLVVTELGERGPSLSEESRPMTASEMLAQRLPSAKKKEAEAPKSEPGKPSAVKPAPPSAPGPSVPPPPGETPR